MPTKVRTQEPTADELIEMIQRKAMPAPEPGDLAVGLDLSQDVDNTAAVKVSELSSAGYTYIYDRRTGDRSITNRNMLVAQLKKTDENGRFVFSVTPPTDVTPTVGTYKCWLHPDDPQREHFDALGLPTCRKMNLTSPTQVKRHMKIRHPTALETIEDEQRQREREEDRAFQRELMASRR